MHLLSGPSSRQRSTLHVAARLIHRHVVLEMGEIVGATILASRAGELSDEFELAMKHRS